MSGTADRQRDAAAFWQQRYQSGQTPWDTATPDPAIFDRLEALHLPPGRALDLGCGTGAAAVELARRGWAITGIDIAPGAIDLARRRAAEAGVSVAFEVADLLGALPVEPASIDFAFDRGCFHSVYDEQRPRFVEQIAACVRPGRWWLTLAGNADDVRRDDEQGPPQMRAATLAALVEPAFAIHHIQRINFTDDGRPTHLAWAVLLRRRSSAAV